jgi:hypothetical protein
MALLTSDSDSIALNEILSSIDEVRANLLVESKKWSHTNSTKSSTIQQILKYHTALLSLRKFVEQKNVFAFVQTFDQQGITMRGLRKCFLSTGLTRDTEIVQRRENALFLFERVCLLMLSELNDKEVLEKTKSVENNPQNYTEARARLNGIKEDAQHERDAKDDDQPERDIKYL